MDGVFTMAGTKRILNVWENNPYFSRNHIHYHAIPTSFNDKLVEERMKDMDLVIFWGGEDIATSLYNEKPKHTSLEWPSMRDVYERVVFNNAVKHNKPMVGICRGAQFLCALNGGKLWQDVNNHGRTHKLYVQGGDVLTCTSTHHQQMRPSPRMELVAFAKESTVKKAETEQEGASIDPEIVFDPVTKSLMIQGHPEYLSHSSDFSKLSFNLIKTYLGVSL